MAKIAFAAAITVKIIITNTMPAANAGLCSKTGASFGTIRTVITGCALVAVHAIPAGGTEAIRAGAVGGTFIAQVALKSLGALAGSQAAQTIATGSVAVTNTGFGAKTGASFTIFTKVIAIAIRTIFSAMCRITFTIWPGAAITASFAIISDKAYFTLAKAGAMIALRTGSVAAANTSGTVKTGARLAIFTEITGETTGAGLTAETGGTSTGGKHIVTIGIGAGVTMFHLTN